MQRRSFLKNAAFAAAASIPFSALVARLDAEEALAGVGYGPLTPTLDQETGLPLLMLPEGFRYVSFGWTGDLMETGDPTPALHDGMAAYKGKNGLARLVRNHEQGGGVPFCDTAYDPQAAGGTTTVVFDEQRGEYVKTLPSISGTIRNCAGGATPWGTWLTCEETTVFTNATATPHGYVFEVPIDGPGNPEPIRDMGRFSHEAVAVDKRTGWVYLTEDAGGSSGFYRFVPNKKRKMHRGGTLSMLRVVGTPLANLGTGYAAGTSFDVEWVPIPQPDSMSPTMPGNFVWAQGRAAGAATFSRLEGCWRGKDAKIYIVSTSGGAAGQGQIWIYDPVAETITLLFESPGADVLNAPDNITVSPRGGLVLCEDGGGEEWLHGLTTGGEIFRFCKNNVVLNGERNGIVGDFRAMEFAGACYSPNGKWLFCNIQTPGITFAITGPWKRGGL